MKERKKRILFLLMAPVLAAGLFTGCGKKSANTETVYLDEPVEVTPSEDFSEDAAEVSEGIGEVAVIPWGTAETAALAGTNTLTFFFKDPSVVLGSGNVGVVNMYDASIMPSVSVTDPGTADVSPMTLDECEKFGWTEGTKINVYLDSCFLPGASYSIIADAGCFTSGSSYSQALTVESGVNFTTKNYGINVSSLPSTMMAGSSLKIPVVLGGGASLAKAEMVSNCMIKQTSFTASGDLDVSFDGPGEASFVLKFSSPDGTVLDTLPLSFTVQ